MFAATLKVFSFYVQTSTMASSNGVPEDTAEVLLVSSDEANSSGPSLEIDVRPTSWVVGYLFD